MEKAIISIITVNYNDANGLEKTIKSVQSQTYKNFEHIIIDGNSTDGSKGVIEKHKGLFSYWVSEPDSGIYSAMNKGIKVAKGEYLLFLNSGDLLNNNKVLDRVSQNLIECLDIYYGNVALLENNKSQKIHLNPKKLTFSFFYQRTIVQQTIFIKRPLFDKIFYYNENLTFVSDWEFLICAICKYNASYKHIDLVVVNYDINGISSDPDNYDTISKERRISFETNFPLFLDDYENLFRLNKRLKSKRVKMVLELEKLKGIKEIITLFLKVLMKFFVKKRKGFAKKLNSIL